MRLVYIRSRIGREVDFEYMNQQLVWHGFSVRKREHGVHRAGNWPSLA